MLSKKECLTALFGFLGLSSLMFCFFFIGREKLMMDVWDVLIISVGSGFSFFIFPHRIKQKKRCKKL